MGTGKPWHWNWDKEKGEGPSRWGKEHQQGHGGDVRALPATQHLPGFKYHTMFRQDLSESFLGLEQEWLSHHGLEEQNEDLALALPQNLDHVIALC